MPGRGAQNPTLLIILLGNGTNRVNGAPGGRIRRPLTARRGGGRPCSPWPARSSWLWSWPWPWPRPAEETATAPTARSTAPRRPRRCPEPPGPRAQAVRARPSGSSATGPSGAGTTGTGGGGAGATTPTGPGGAAFGQPGTIAFASRRFGTPGIFVVTDEGTGEHRLTPAQGEYFTPVWSPDGKRVAFASRRADNTDIYVVNADGSNEKRLTTDPGNDFDPGLVARRAAHRLLAAGRSGNRPLTCGSSTPAAAGSAASPRARPTSSARSGRPTAPASPTPGSATRAAIWVMGPDGGGARAIVESAGQNLSPVWSPDGSPPGLRQQPERKLRRLRRRRRRERRLRR